MNITDEALQTETDKLLKEVAIQKDAIIRKRLKEHKLLYILNDISKRRFKRLMIEDDGKFEHIYVDNKTIDGLRLVSFQKPLPTLQGEEINVDLKYF